MSWYARIIAHHPYVVLAGVAVIAGLCLVIPLTTHKLPDFNDPQLGFETRGTVISKRLTAWENLQDATGSSGPLTLDPNDVRLPSKFLLRPKPSSKSVESKSSVLSDKMTLWNNELPKAVRPVLISVSTTTPNDIPQEKPVWAITLNDTSETVGREVRNRTAELALQQDEWETLEKEPALFTHYDDTIPHSHDHDHNHLGSDGFFCSSPSPDYSRVVFTSSSDLFTLESILSMCRIDEVLRQGHEFHALCETISPERCCLSWSLGNYIALLSNRSSCSEITDEDLNSTRTLLEFCSPYYHNMQLTHDCEDPLENKIYCKHVPAQCKMHNAVYNIINYIVDVGFLPPYASTESKLDASVLFLPIARTTATMKYFRTLNVDALKEGNIEVTAMELGLKTSLFDDHLIHDTWMIGAGGTFILLSMWVYTGSLFVTFMTVIAIAFSLGISYFMYTLIFELEFFPFMNLLASIVAIGLGADDAFIFCKVWQCTKSGKTNGTLVKLVDDTLRQATLSMMVTSLTTAAAFYASYISSISAICCFSIFAGTATLANFLLMVTWLPASVVVSERWSCPLVLAPQWMQLDNKLRPAKEVAGQVRATLDKFLLMGVTKLRYFWLVLLGGVAIGSIIVVFYHPKLRLPDSRDFQLFQSSHVFERYDLIYRDKFWFEKPKRTDGGQSDSFKLPLRFVWGVRPVDNGDYLDPYSRGHLVMDEMFDMAAPESQAWLFSFCRQLRNQSFYQPMWGPLLPNCFIENFVAWMQRRCIDTVDNIDRTPCCETESFPYERDVFELCIVHAMKQIFNTPGMFFFPGVAGPRFSKKTVQVKAVVVEFDSNQTHSMSFEEMNRFFKQVEQWAEEQFESAPEGMKRGWFISQLDFYDLQRTLSRDTLATIGVSMGIALAVLLLVTLNILISLYAILTIIAIIFVTVAILVLLGWKLNVLESVAISVAIGLAVDFSLHYGVHYRLAPDREGREAASAHAISRMAGPTVMAALTTAAAGAFMLPSTVLAYIQIGAFLIVVMGVSWIYSTFFLGSLLHVAGPEHGFGQFTYPQIKKWCMGESPTLTCSEDPIDKLVFANVMSESNMSTTSAICHLHSSESHELEALTGRVRRSRAQRSGGLCMGGQHPHGPRVAVPLPAEQSPSATSATTIVLVEDLEVETRPRPEDSILRY